MTDYLKDAIPHQRGYYYVFCAGIWEPIGAKTEKSAKTQARKRSATLIGYVNERGQMMPIKL